MRDSSVCSAISTVQIVVLLALCFLPIPVNAEQAEVPFTLTFDNRPGGEIRLGSGTEELILGHVVQPALEPDFFPFAAARYGQDSTVVATAVNSLHLRITEGKMLSIVPRESSKPRLGEMVTDVTPGTSLFSYLAPRVGDPVYLSSADGKREPLRANYFAALGDRWVIRSHWRAANGRIVFENYPGGHVLLEQEGACREVAMVVHPVRGVGRFEGTQYAPPSTVRANHPGVICISTSPLGAVGGFQIVPKDYLEQSGQQKFLGAPQWMTVDAEQGLAGKPPLFSGMILPCDRVWWQSSESEELSPLPELSGRQDDAFFTRENGTVQEHNQEDTTERILDRRFPGPTLKRLIIQLQTRSLEDYLRQKGALAK